MNHDGHDHYGNIARFYAAVLDPLNAPLRAASLKLHPIGSGDSVLDVGCGTGRLLEMYADAGASVSGIDMSYAMLAEATKLLGDRADLRSGDATAMPYEDDSFDLAICSLMIHELDPDIQHGVLTEMARVVAPDGRVLIIDYRVGSLRFKGRILRTLSTVAERMAGSNHYTNWRKYMAAGALSGMLPSVPLDLDREKISAGGNLNLWLLKHS
jgi:ubiquinone/menaquinone biosynthesis C-methylase UbiE